MSERPLLLDLYCCQGGAAMGYHRAGFKILGVDKEPQPRYPFPFVQADALEFLASANLSTVAAIHASPPCQDHSSLSSLHQLHGTGWLLSATRDALSPLGKPWVIENVPQAKTRRKMRADFKLCGCMFGLPGLRRERWFETSPQLFDMRAPCSHQGRTITVAGHGADGRYYRDGGEVPTVQTWREAMGIDWMTQDGMAQAIPPAYTEYIGAQLLAIL